MKKLMLCLLFLSFLSVANAMESDFTYHLLVKKIGATEHGTAVAVYCDNIGHIILTANHCVKDVNEATLTNASGTFLGKVVYRDIELDIAVLKCNAIKKYTELRDELLQVETPLVFCHYPRAIGPKTSKGVVMEIKAGSINYGALAEGFYHGSSGCPVFIKEEVVGIALAGVAYQGTHGEMVEGQAVFLPAKRILQSIKYYLQNKHDAEAKAVVVDLEEKF